MINLNVPYLISGAGRTPANGGCIMQVASWVATGGWTDSPQCVHPILRNWAIGANDAFDNDERQQLLDLLPRMLNTNTHDIGVAVLYSDPEMRREVEFRFAVISANANRAWDEYVESTRDLPQATPDERILAARARTQASARLCLWTVHELLNAFDEITGRGAPETPDLNELCQLVPKTLEAVPA